MREQGKNVTTTKASRSPIVACSSRDTKHWHHRSWRDAGGHLDRGLRISGLFCLFDRIEYKHKFIKDETDETLREIFEPEE